VMRTGKVKPGRALACSLAERAPAGAAVYERFVGIAREWRESWICPSDVVFMAMQSFVIVVDLHIETTLCVGDGRLQCGEENRHTACVY
jgi:hypothetical protein